MRRDIRGATVVITGASSGIGRATARAFAVQGARLVLGARRKDALQEVVAECERAGAHALAQHLHGAHAVRVMHRYLTRAPSAPVGDVTLFEPSSAQTGTSGGWRAAHD